MPLNIADVKTWIQANIKDIHSSSDIARQFNTSIETLRKEFRRKEQKNLHTFLVETRVIKAQQLLIETDDPCFAICIDVGFTREDTGAKTFKKIAGMTMETYRKFHKKTNNALPKAATHIRQPQ